jgi:hypothetical protein
VRDWGLSSKWPHCDSQTQWKVQTGVFVINRWVCWTDAHYCQPETLGLSPNGVLLCADLTSTDGLTQTAGKRLHFGHCILISRSSGIFVTVTWEAGLQGTVAAAAANPVHLH